MLTDSTFEKAVINAGYVLMTEIIRDENIHRFGKNKECWYICGVDWGIADDWSGGLERVNWFAQAVHLSIEKKAEIDSKIEFARKARETGHEEAAKKAEQIVSQARQIGNSAYLNSKRVKAYGVCFSSYEGRLCATIPARDINGKLWTIQSIYDDGKKYFLAGGRKTGCFHAIGNLTGIEPIIFVEGYATGATVHEATGSSVVVCFDAGNLDPVIKSFRERYPASKFIIAADNDAFKEKNTGKLKAEEAAEKYGGTVVLPEFSESFLKHKPTDFNDLMILKGIDIVKQQLTTALQSPSLKALRIDDFLKLKIPPREMLIDPIIPSQGLVMLHAIRGIGKTYISLTIAVTLASGGSIFGNKWNCPRPRKVLLVDGEMPVSVLQERLISIILGLNIGDFDKSNLQVITPDLQAEGIPDLSTLAGQKLVEEHLSGVDLLILDNLSALCRTGKENDAESWLPVQGWLLSLRKRGISVLFVHHSNKNAMQRGTSKREDLLDTVINLKQPHDYERSEGARFEVHYEKSRGFYGEKAKPFEVKLKLEDGNAVWEVIDIQDLRFKHVLAMEKEGMTQRDMAEELKISTASVNRLLKAAKAAGGTDGK